MYTVTKTYPHSLGLSACFRQHRAESHCKFLHGYPLSFVLEFGAYTLDANNWVINFGGLKEIKKWLETSFDHRLIVAADDPKWEVYKYLFDEGLIKEPLILPHTGCESFAKYVFDHVAGWLNAQELPNSVVLLRVTCAEHEGNSASYIEG